MLLSFINFVQKLDPDLLGLYLNILVLMLLVAFDAHRESWGYLFERAENQFGRFVLVF